ncbi:hypothetical protein, partial [Escherichia coli]|uniref:hypothetical protein n=1 Tax=Escherichia coli TaxID=562 RepID=UPI0019677C20
LRMNMMISYQELVRTFPRQLYLANSFIVLVSNNKILLGAQNGAQVISYKIFIIMFNELYSYSIPAFAPSEHQ